MNKKGLVYTIDAIFALVIAVFLISAILFYMKDPNILYNEQALQKFSQGSLTMMEKDGTFRNAVSSSSNTEIGTFLDSLPRQLCASISIIDQNLTQAVGEVNKTNCNIPDEYVFTRRLIVADSKPYYAEMYAGFYELS